MIDTTLYPPHDISHPLAHALTCAKAGSLGIGLVFNHYTGIHPDFQRLRRKMPALLTSPDTPTSLMGHADIHPATKRLAASIAALAPQPLINAAERHAMRLGLENVTIMVWLTPTTMIVQSVSYHSPILGLHYNPTGMSGHERLNTERTLMTTAANWALPAALASKALT